MGDHLVWIGDRLPDFVYRLIPGARTPTQLENAIAFLDRWQTLISGFAAILAAVLTVYLLSRQVSIEEKRDDATKKRAERDARLRVTPALSPLSVYVEEMLLYWARNDRKQAIPTFPKGSIDALMTASLDTDDETFQSIRELVSWAQVFEARATGFLVRDAKPPLNWRGVLVSDLIYLYCLINPLYKFGRDQFTTVPFNEPETEDMVKAIPSLWRLGVAPAKEDELNDEIRVAIETYYSRKN